MESAEVPPNNLIELEGHPLTLTDPGRVRRFLQGKREEASCVEAAARFAAAVPPLGDTEPRTWLVPLVDSLPKKPTEADLQISVAGAARYFEFLKAQGAIHHTSTEVCEYDLLTAAHIVEQMLRVGLDRDHMKWEACNDAAEKVKECDRKRAQLANQGVAGDVTWLGGWVQRRGTWVVAWVPAGGSVAVASAAVEAHERADALGAFYVEAFAHAAQRGQAPARTAVFSSAQERALRDFARDVDIDLLPVYRLRDSAPLRFWADEVLLG